MSPIAKHRTRWILIGTLYTVGGLLYLFSFHLDIKRHGVIYYWRGVMDPIQGYGGVCIALAAGAYAFYQAFRGPKDRRGKRDDSDQNGGDPAQ